MVISGENVNKYRFPSLTADKNVNSESSESSYCHMKGQKSITVSTRRVSLVPPAIFSRQAQQRGQFLRRGSPLTNHVAIGTLLVAWVAGKDGVCHYSGKI